jgi:hypothetical protein
MTEAHGSAGAAEWPSRRGPSSGGYYWFPGKPCGVLTWTVLTCHELGLGAEVGHVDLWPSVIDQLAEAWSKDRHLLARHLRAHYTGLPRGRVTEPRGRFLVCHGNDSPVGNWKTRVRRAFGLQGVPLKADFDDHERTLEEDRRMVEAILGIAIGPGAQTHDG